MNRREFQELQGKIFSEARQIALNKGADYSGEDDAFSNFKRHAEMLNLEPEIIWAVYAGKHWDAIVTYCRKGQVESEPIEGQILDLINYLTLLYSSVEDKLGRVISSEVTEDNWRDLRKQEITNDRW